MKGILIISFLVFFNSAFSQISTGISTSFMIAEKTYEEVDYGINLNFNLDYLIAERVDIGLSFRKSIFISSIFDDLSFSAVNLNAKYFILNKEIKPYFGSKIGYHFKSFSYPLDYGKYKENTIGIEPFIGIQFNSFMKNKLRLKVEYSYSYLPFDIKAYFSSFSIGLVYSFKNSDNKD